MSRDWSRYEGRLVGDWRIESFLGERGDTAFFTGSGADRQVLLQVVGAGSPGANAALASWTLAQRLAHEHLLRVHGAGEAAIDELGRVAWGALDLPEDDLSEIAPRRPLEPAEVRDIAHGAALALEYLHAEGLTHGAVLPENLFLVEGAWKLSVDSLAPGDTAAKLADVRQLGRTMVWALSGGMDQPGQTPSAGAMAMLDLPAREIAIGCLDRGWSAADAVAALEGRYAPPGGDAPAPRPPKPPAARSNIWPVLTAVVAVLLMVIAFALNGRGNRNVKASTTPAPKAAVAQPPVQNAQPAPEQAQTARLQNGTADREAVHARPPEGPWAVVAATYGTRADADKRARMIRARWRQFQARVLPTTGSAEAYHVVLGSGMNRKTAVMLEHKARSAGVAHDTYATKMQAE
jgi:hypothetical protein